MTRPFTIITCPDELRAEITRTVEARGGYRVEFIALPMMRRGHDAALIGVRLVTKEYKTWEKTIECYAQLEVDRGWPRLAQLVEETFG